MSTTDKELWKIFSTKTLELLKDDFSPLHLEIVTEYMNALDTLMEQYAYHNDWSKEQQEYETIHTEYGNYRWKNNV